MSGNGAQTAGYARDREARLIAQTTFDRPLVLQAGAGTGKTATLVARIVAWSLGPGWRRAEEEAALAKPAGSGPGGVVADRVAARVLDRVVAITFTEAAAAEMASKVGQAFTLLASGAVPVGVDAAALPGGDATRERAAAAVVALDHLVVSTIHAFCRRLLAGNPLDAGLHPGFTVDAENVEVAAAVRETVEDAFRAAFVEARGGGLLALAAHGAGPAEVAAVLEGLAARGVPASALATDALSPEVARVLASQVRRPAERLAAIFEGREGAFRRAKNAAALARGLPLLADRLAEARVRTVDDVVGVVAQALPENLLAHLSGWGKGKLGVEEREIIGVAADAFAGHAGELARVAAHVLSLDPELLELARRAVWPLLVRTYTTLRARGAETYAALLRDARDVLRRDAHVAARRRAEIAQLLVDEFQDTDPIQCEILRVLALEGPAAQRPGLFLIGDPKQSIYGWRNADLAAYDGFLELVRRGGGQVLTLAQNFRSLPPILAEVERAVGPVMVEEAGVQPAFEPLLPSPERAGAPSAAVGDRPPVEYWVSWPASADGTGVERGGVRDALEVEAAALADDIRALHDSGGVAWREIGVLLRAMSDVDDYLQEFRDADIPYVVERDRSYYRRREVIEASALLRTVLDPGDHLAMLTVLRSSLVGVPDAALIPLWARGFPSLVSGLGGVPDAVAAVQAMVREVAGGLPPGVPGLERVRGWEDNLAVFLDAVAGLRDAFSSKPSSEFVERLRTLTLFEAGEAARTLGAYRVANLDRFFRTLLAAMERETGNPYAVLRTFRSAVAEELETEEGRPLSAAEDAVRVMTIHKAKGLDFAHAYLVQAHHRRRGEAVRPVDAEEVGGTFEYVLFGAATPGWVQVAERRRRVAEAETVRTLYVAMTRAKDRLVIAGSWPDVRPGGPSSHLDLLAGRLPEGGLARLASEVAAGGGRHADRGGVRWIFPALAHPERPPYAPPRVRDAFAVEEIARRARELADARAAAAARMRRPFSAPASAEAHRLLRQVLAEDRDSTAPAGLPGRGDAGPSVATAVGSAIHGVLEELKLNRDLAEGLLEARAGLPRRLGDLLAGAGLDEAVRRARSILDRLAASAALRRLAAIAAQVVARELPVLLPPDGSQDAPVGFVSATIDLVYQDPESRDLVIADYKTDDVRTEEAIADRVSAYAAQGVAYRRALREALALDSDPRFELWFLRADRIVTVPG